MQGLNRMTTSFQGISVRGMNDTFVGLLQQHLNAPLANHHAFFLAGALLFLCGLVLLCGFCCVFLNIGGTRDCLRAAERRKYSRLNSVHVVPSASEEPLLTHSPPPPHPPAQSNKAKHGLRSPPVQSVVPSLPILQPPLSTPPPPSRPRGPYFTAHNVYGRQ